MNCCLLKNDCYAWSYVARNSRYYTELQFIFSVSSCLGVKDSTFISANKHFDMPRVCIQFVEPLIM